MAEVGIVMRDLLMELDVPTLEGIRRGDVTEIGKLATFKRAILKCAAADLSGTDPNILPEAVFTTNQMRKLVLTASPCLRGLMRESGSGELSANHDEMVECAVSYFLNVRAVLEEACEQFAPHLWDYYDFKFKER